MTNLLEAEFPRTLDGLIARFATPAGRGMRVEAWLFEDAAARRAGERALAAHGVTATLRSAYKPVLHALREEADLRDLAEVLIHTPTHPEGSALRFRLETYPLAGLLGDVPVRFADGTDELDYEAVITKRSGERVTHRIFAPNRIRPDHLGKPTLSSTGWLRVWRPGSTAPDEDGPLETEYEVAFHAIMAAVMAHDWGNASPCFETLDIAVETGGIEERLPYQDECVSTREALHEDLYFSILEVFQRHFGLAAGDRGLQPGQIIPDIRAGNGPTKLRVALLPPVARPIAGDPGETLAEASRPLTPARIQAELASLGGHGFTATSVQGRLVLAAQFPGSGPGILVSAGQHANETSGVVGALRAAPLLQARGVNFALIPQENPDGYALHYRLREANPGHMHHAARYTALGDDLQVRKSEPFYEKAARLEAFRRIGAQLHINLHGYPAHEWTRPLTDYVPRGFAPWTIPKGFFLILRHAAGLAEMADAFIRALTARVSQTPGLRAFNDRHIATYLAHGEPLTVPVYDGIPCMVSQSDDQDVPMTLITEYPDETIYDDAFRLAHTTQMATVLAAAEIFLAGGGIQI
ncbi:MAG TPA: peptidase M14 [Acetobacteraceae bacterium]|jgi:hypothetical protein